MDDLISRAVFRPYSNEEYYSNLDVERALKAIPTVDAIPVEWLKTQINEALDDNETELASDIGWLIRKYINEQGCDSGCHLEVEFNSI